MPLRCPWSACSMCIYESCVLHGVCGVYMLTVLYEGCVFKGGSVSGMCGERGLRVGELGV